jgi:tetratricopeptide (TPR) repeat protein
VPDTEPPAVPDQEVVSITADVTTTEKPYEVMATARESYWLRDFDAAEQHYQELIRIDPDNPDGYGEMGNMYFSQGNWEQAAAAFYEAGTRLLKQGHVLQAQQMVEVIRGLNGPQAEELEAQVVAASN